MRAYGENFPHIFEIRDSDLPIHTATSKCYDKSSYPLKEVLQLGLN